MHEDERDLILDFYRRARPPWFPFVAFQLWTGCRPSGTTALRVGDVDLLRGNGIPEAATLVTEVAAWEAERNGAKCKVRWQFTTADARVKLQRLYPVIEPLGSSRTKHYSRTSHAVLGRGRCGTSHTPP